jgi:hypothetical protein
VVMCLLALPIQSRLYLKNDTTLMEAPKFSPDNSLEARQRRISAYLRDNVEDVTFLDRMVTEAFKTPVVRELPPLPPRAYLYLVPQPQSDYDQPNSDALAA